MATKKALATVKPSQSIATLDSELAAEVQALKEMVGQPGGRRFKIEPSGSFTSPEGLDLGPDIRIVILDFTSRNELYLQPYDRNNLVPPDCYAIGKVISTMVPEADSPLRQADACGACPNNQFGSAATGMGKACKNTRELAFLLVDPDNPNAHNEPGAPIYTLSVTPTSIKAFDAIVPMIARALGGPPIKAVIDVHGTPAGTYATLSFHSPVPNPDYAAHAARRAECLPLLTRKPDFAAYAAKAPPPRRGVPARPTGARVAPARR